MSLFSTSLRRVPRLMMLLQLVGNALLVLFGYAWLHVPDSHIWELLVSVLFGAAIAAAFLWLHTSTIQRTRTTIRQTAVWLGMVLLAVWLLVNHFLVKLTEHISTNIYTRAGYWNSQLGPHMRTIFTYERLIDWQNDFVVFLACFLIPALLLPFVVETVARGVKGSSWTNALRCIFRWKYWFVAMVVLAVVHFAAGWILGWHPLHTVSGELISVAVRGAVVYVIYLVAYFIALGATSELLEPSR